MRILLVEDDKSLGGTIRTWLQMDGYAVDWLERGDQVDSALKTFDYRFLILDRGLPGLDGDAVLQALRARSDFVPVLVITARDTLQDRIKGLDLGADAYLVKSFDLEELSARLRAALRRGAIAAPVLLTFRSPDSNGFRIRRMQATSHSNRGTRYLSSPISLPLAGQPCWR